MSTSTETSRRIARVKWFNPRAGFGFLTDCVSAEDVFVHHSRLTTPDNVYRTLTQGEYVEYETILDNNGKSLANNVTGVNQGPLLCQRPAPARRGRTTSTRGRGGSTHKGTTRRTPAANSASTSESQ